MQIWLHANKYGIALSQTSQFNPNKNVKTLLSAAFLAQRSLQVSLIPTEQSNLRERERRVRNTDFPHRQFLVRMPRTNLSNPFCLESSGPKLCTKHFLGPFQVSTFVPLSSEPKLSVQERETATAGAFSQTNYEMPWQVQNNLNTYLKPKEVPLYLPPPHRSQRQF